MQSNSKTFAIVIVVYPKEFKLLKLLARSIDKFLDGNIFYEVNIFINYFDDADFDKYKFEINSYFSKNVNVFSGYEVFDEPKIQLSSNLIRSMVTCYPILNGRIRTGWHQHDGWQMQQAFKLVSVNFTSADFTIFLDAKNILIRPLGPDHFISEFGKAKSRLSRPSKQHEKWISASLKVLNFKFDFSDVLLTHFVTPFCVDNNILRDTLVDIEKCFGSAELLFSQRLNRATEFMLINAFCLKKFGNVESVFDQGLFRSFSLFSSMSDDLQSNILLEAISNEGLCIGLHSSIIDQMSSKNKGLVNKILTHSGLGDHIYFIMNSSFEYCFMIYSNLLHSGRGNRPTPVRLSQITAPCQSPLQREKDTKKSC